MIEKPRFPHHVDMANISHLAASTLLSVSRPFITPTDINDKYRPSHDFPASHPHVSAYTRQP